MWVLQLFALNGAAIEINTIEFAVGVPFSPWQSSAVTESEAERRNTARIQRQHRRSTQGVTKEHLEEASRIAMAEAARRRGSAASQSAASNTSTSSNPREAAVVRLASEERDSTSMCSDRSSASTERSCLEGSTANRLCVAPKESAEVMERGSLERAPSTTTTTSSTTPLSLPSTTMANQAVVGIRRKSQGHATTTAPPTRTSTATVTVGRVQPRLPGQTITNSSSITAPTYTINARPAEMNLNYKALYEKEKLECERLRKELDEVKRAHDHNGSVSTLRSASSRFRNGSPASGPAPVMKSASGNSLDDNERRTMERKIADLEIQLKELDDLNAANLQLRAENAAMMRVLAKLSNPVSRLDT
ncbi:hypothetical protein Y032_0404g839 [Ancylostoma ceylanicum]|nr:hypothetical protein Y032_0404g839 [Ancylostoma ceylanicum]